MMVQRVLGCKNLKSAKKAMIGSGIFVFFQFSVFLLVGSLLSIFMHGAQMEKDSMEYLQAAKDVTAYSDTYIMMSGTNTITNTNLITPVEFPDYSAGSYSSIDSSLAFNLKTRL
jgi:hypothetical protein